MRAFTRDHNTGEWVERHLLADSWNATDTVNERSVATLTLIDPTGTLHFQKGVGVRLQRPDDTIIFNGFIERATESNLGPDGTRRHILNCVDLHYLADKRIIADAWTGTTAGDIIRSIISTTLAAEGVTPGVIHDGPTLREYTANYVFASHVLTDLSERSGFWWRINLDGTLDFCPPGALPFWDLSFDSTLVTTENVNAFDDTSLRFDQTNTHSFDYEAGRSLTFDQVGLTFDHVGTAVLSVDEALAEDVSVTRHGSSYRNRQWIRGGADRTAPQTEHFVGDGARRSFTVGFPIAIEPTVEVNRGSGWVTETVGVAGIQAGRQWTWSYRSHTLQQDALEPVLTDTHQVRVTYVGEFNIISRVDLPAEIAERRIVEGGTGIVEHVLEDKSVKGRDAGFERAGTLLEHHGEVSNVLRFSTDFLRFRAGRLASVNLPEAGIHNVDALVQTVEWFSISGHVRCIVTLITGPSEGSWATYFARLLGRVDSLSQDAVGGEVDVVTTPVQFEKDWTIGERPNIWFEAYPQVGLHPGSALVPAFRAEERVLRMAWLRGGVEGGRVIPTLQTSTPGSLTTIVVLSVNDAIAPPEDPWTHLAWFGGPGASDTPGSGIKVAEVPYVFSKTNVEQIQVTRIDRKWS